MHDSGFSQTPYIFGIRRPGLIFLAVINIKNIFYMTEQVFFLFLCKMFISVAAGARGSGVRCVRLQPFVTPGFFVSLADSWLRGDRSWAIFDFI